jgi:hypothetical protein
MNIKTASAHLTKRLRTQWKYTCLYAVGGAALATGGTTLCVYLDRIDVTLGNVVTLADRYALLGAVLCGGTRLWKASAGRITACGLAALTISFAAYIDNSYQQDLEYFYVEPKKLCEQKAQKDKLTNSCINNYGPDGESKIKMMIRDRNLAQLGLH